MEEVAAGADIEYQSYRDLWGRTPLHQAVQGHNKEIVKLLMQRGADPLIVDNIGDSPLFQYLFGEPDYDVIENLLSVISDVNIVNDRGDSLLHQAARRGLPLHAAMLINRGANEQARNRKGQTALDVVKAMDNPDEDNTDDDGYADFDDIKRILKHEKKVMNSYFKCIHGEV